MDKELEQDLKDWFYKEHREDYRELMREYFKRIIDYRGLNEFGFSEEKIPLKDLCDYYFPVGAVRQAVGNTARLFEVFFSPFNHQNRAYDFTGLSSELSNQEKPYADWEDAYNVYSVPNKELLEILQDTSLEPVRPKILIKAGKVYDHAKQNHLLYEPRKGSRPGRILELLASNPDGFSAKAIAGHLSEKNKETTHHDISSAIAGLNETFRNKSGFASDLILSNPYRLNRGDFEITVE